MIAERQETAPPLRMTEDEFEAWCMAGEDRRAEFVDGEVVLMSPVSIDHHDIHAFLATLLRVYLDLRPGGKLLFGDFMVRLRPGLRRVPDLHYVLPENEARIHRTRIEGATDAAFEVVSADSIDRDYRQKYAEYEAAGVREYWVIDPRHERVRLHRLTPAGVYQSVEEVEGRLTSEVIEGFWLKAEWLWRRPMPATLECLREMGVLP
jgi:Uma2 family endonuclease